MLIKYKKHLLTFTLFLAFATIISAQQTHKEPLENQGVITYAFKSNGKEMKGAPPLKIYFKNNLAHLVAGGNANINQQQYIDYKNKLTWQIMTLKDGSRYTLKTPFDHYEKPILTGETDTILGYRCKKAKVFIRSNTIEIWFTQELALKGSPTLGVAPGLGLILKTIRNGNSEIFATDISFQKVSGEEGNLPENTGVVVDEATYKRKEIDNRFLTFPVFSHQQINFTDSIHNPANMDMENVTYRYAAGTIAIKKINLPDSGNYSVFANLTQYSNGDAYDRTGTVFIIPTEEKNSFLNGLRNGKAALPVYKDKQGKEYQGVIATHDYLPPLELMRFFTPFGVRAFNQQSKIAGYNWPDSVNYKQDITDLLPRLRGEVWIGVFIGNYDKGGHTVNLDLSFHPRQSRKEKKADWVEPIFNTLNIMEMAGQNYGTMFDNDSLTVSVNIPEGLKTLSLRYITTGHGGWGNGDEFNKKLNDIFMDGTRIFSFIPWRTDCATYRMLNPSSGNFGDGLSSSDLSRSNWCPGTTTNPVYIPINDFAPGKHTFKVAIPLGKTEGTSFSSWSVSGCLIGSY